MARGMFLDNPVADLNERHQEGGKLQIIVSLGYPYVELYSTEI